MCLDSSERPLYGGSTAFFYTTKKCLFCDDSFSIKDKSHTYQKYCSKHCYEMARQAYAKYLNKEYQSSIYRVCRCGTSFIPNIRATNWQKYCSIKCQKRFIALDGYKKNPLIQNERSRKYRQSEKGKISNRIRAKIYSFNRKVSLRRSQGNLYKLSRHDVEAFIKRDKCCVYCGSDDRLTLDHIVPISKGGNNSRQNIVLACVHCNSQKRDIEVIKWCAGKHISIPQVVLNLLSEQKSQVKLVEVRA